MKYGFFFFISVFQILSFPAILLAFLSTFYFSFCCFLGFLMFFSILSLPESVCLSVVFRTLKSFFGDLRVLYSVLLYCKIRLLFSYFHMCKHIK